MSIPRRVLTSCAVCGGQPNGSRYGPVTCLGCMVFFRRAIQQGKSGNCDRQSGMKASCRNCRLQECLNAGMNPNAIQFRDKLGPRKPKKAGMNEISNRTDTDFDCLVQLQRKQRELHQRYSGSNRITEESGLVKIKNKYYHRARPYDIELTLKLSFRNATDWAKQFNSFWNLKEIEKKLVISEFGISFLLVDQAYKTACKSDRSFWLLQNDSYLNPDYFFGMPAEDKATEESEYVVAQARCHAEFVDSLLKCLKKPFSLLKIDKLECVLLKTLLLLAPSFPGRVSLDDSEKVIARCMSNLMSYSYKKSPENGMVRFGEIILLMQSIRSTVKQFYNQTKRSYCFDISKFDTFVRSNFVT
ncbi:hypothetical protein CAEBREN_32690 [Caenorhabditis brenneri]|uniref:Uncharacterized protein n=1 Tax=Caenorhabditis brenneri TaxID=135651 RepID=G0PLX9_CAEBE|nr:hypothetical protein CAEBREN_32690 [Caenorhabditis brenneri]